VCVSCHKAALENVRVEELQLELSSAIKSRPTRQTTTSAATSSNNNNNINNTSSSCYGTSASMTHGISSHGHTSLGSNVLSGTSSCGVAPSSLGHHHHHTAGSGLNHSSGLTAQNVSSSSSSAHHHATVSWAPTPTQAQGTEIDRIMAKIEQARLSIANVCV
jgi:hypothetical protein